MITVMGTFTQSCRQRWSGALPVVSALIVTVLGIGITFSGLATYLGRG